MKQLLNFYHYTHVCLLKGELQKASGTVEVGRDDVSYFNQDPFIMNDTVKGNIVFGRSNEDIDEELYRLAVKSSCLEHDFKMFINGDQTEIGEKGINMRCVLVNWNQVVAILKTHTHTLTYEPLYFSLHL